MFYFACYREDYDDHRLNCGGVEDQWGVWGGRCGTCGDEYGLPQPRPHEQGGTFGEGILARNYTQGQVNKQYTRTGKQTNSTQGQENKQYTRTGKQTVHRDR